MKQVIQSTRTGHLTVKDVPRPSAAPSELLVATGALLVSAGTERMVVDFARKGITGKACARPDPVKKALNKTRLDEPLPLGYSAVGVVTGIGGRRLIGEGCHFIDMARFFAGSPIETVHMSDVAMNDPAADDVTVTLLFADGELAAIVYTSLGDAGFPKEQIKVFAGGTVFVIDNFRSWQATARGSTQQRRSGGQDKGHRDALKAFVATFIAGGEPPVPAGELLEASHTAVAEDRAPMSGQWIRL